MRDAQGGYASLLHLAVAGGHVEIVEVQLVTQYIFFNDGIVVVAAYGM